MTHPTDDRSATDTPSTTGAEVASTPRPEPAGEQTDDLKHTALHGEAAREQARETGRAIREQARAAGEQAKEQVRSLAARQKQAAAGQVGGFAQALRRASGDLEERGQDLAARYVNQAAEGLDRASDALERRDFDELMTGVEDFARRQPIAFLGGAVVAGFGLARLLKSSAERRHGPGEQGAYAPGRAPATAGGGAPGPQTSGAAEEDMPGRPDMAATYHPHGGMPGESR